MQKVKYFFSLSKDFIKRKKKISITLGVVLLIILALVVFNKKNNGIATVTAQIGDFRNIVSVSGKVIPASEVELSFKNTGRIEKVYYTLEDKKPIKAGTLLAQMEASEARKNLAEAQLALERFKVENSKQNLNTDLQQAYDDGFTASSEAILDLSTVLDNLEDILNEEILSSEQARNNSNLSFDYRREAEKLYYKANTSFKESQKEFRLLNRDSDPIVVEKNLENIYQTTKILLDALKNTKSFVDQMAKNNSDSTEYQTAKDTLYDDTNTINDNLTNLLNKKEAIQENKDTFVDSGLEIKSLELAIAEARSTLENYFIRAPFDGILTKIETKVGETMAANSLAIAMMSQDTFQIESYIPEVNIALVQLGYEAKVTLDAYGDKIVFLAKVISVDPAETMKEGVSTYKVKLQFLENDPRILSGMTANVSIEASYIPNVIVLPEGVIYEKNGLKYVQVKKEEKREEVQIQTGSVSSLGQVEIISGVQAGDVIILKPEQ